MKARLELLLPEQPGRKRSRGSVYVTIVRRDDGGPEVSLFEEFNENAVAWEDERREPQLDELLRLLTQAVERGCRELFHLDDDTLRDRAGKPLEDASRGEGLARALPLERFEDWKNSLDPALREHAELLAGLNALRLYCYRFGNNLILFGGNIKRMPQVHDPGSNVLAEFNEANRLARCLAALEHSGRLCNSSRTKRIDLDRLAPSGWFEV